MQWQHLLHQQPQQREKSKSPWEHEHGQPTLGKEQKAQSQEVHYQQQISQQRDEHTQLEEQKHRITQEQRQMQQQVEGHLRPEQQKCIHQAQPTEEHRHEQLQNHHLQEHHHQPDQPQHANLQSLQESHHAWQRHPPHRGGDGEQSPTQRGGEVGGIEDQQPSQFMAWPGGSTLASALWNAQEKVVHHFKQLQLLENPFTASSTTTKEISPHNTSPPKSAQTLSQPQQPPSSSASPPSSPRGATEVKGQTAAPAAEQAAGTQGESGRGEAASARTANEIGVAAAAAAALEAVSLHAVTAETLARRRGSVAKPASLSGLDTTPYRLVTFANGRPLHVHHICSPPPHAGGRSVSTPGKVDGERLPHEAAATDPAAFPESRCRCPGLHEQEHDASRGTPTSKAADPKAADPKAADPKAAETVEGEAISLRTLSRQLSEDKRSPVALGAVGATALLGTPLSRKGSLRDDKSESNSTSNSRGTAVRKLVVGGEEARRPAPPLGDVEGGPTCITSPPAPAAAASLKIASAGSSHGGSASGVFDVDAMSFPPGKSAAAGASKKLHAAATPSHRPRVPTNLSCAGTFPAAADSSAATVVKDNSAVRRAAAPCAGQRVVVYPNVGVRGNSGVGPPFLATPVAAYQAEGAEGYTLTADATGRAALLQLAAATSQLSSISWELLLLCVLLPLVYILYFSAPLHPASERTAAAAAEGAAGRNLLPGSGCVEAVASPGFLVHALITVYILVVVNTAWNLWRLQLPHEMYLYSQGGCLLRRAQGREGRGTTRPQRAASAVAESSGAEAGRQPGAAGGVLRRTVSAAAGYGGSCLARCSIGMAGRGGTRVAAETEVQEGESKEDENADADTVVDATDSVEPPTIMSDEVVADAGEGNSKREVLNASWTKSDDEIPLQSHISSFPTSTSPAASSDIVHIAEYCRYGSLENPPPPAAAPPPPRSDWPQWPVLLRATQDPWVVQKTQEVLQQHLNRMEKRSMTSNQTKGKDHFLPTLRYPPPPLLFMTPEVVDPHQVVLRRALQQQIVGSNRAALPWRMITFKSCIWSAHAVSFLLDALLLAVYVRRFSASLWHVLLWVLPVRALPSTLCLYLVSCACNALCIAAGAQGVFLVLMLLVLLRLCLWCCCRLFICIPSPGSNATKKQQGPYGNRAMQACVQGQFLQPYRVGEVLTGQAFFRPLRSLPPQWMVSLGLKVAKQLTSTLQEDIFAVMPYFLTPAVCSAETLHVAHSRRLSEEGGGEQLLQTERRGDEDEEYIAPPDVTLLDVPEETRLLGGPFAHGGVSAQQRKSMLSSRQLLRDLVFDPRLIYTFNFVQNIFFPSTYDFDLGFMKLDLSPFLNQQPIEIMALIDDTFVRDSSLSSRKQSLQLQKQHTNSSKKKKKKKENRQVRGGVVNARREEQREEKVAAGGMERAEDAEAGQGEISKSTSQGNKKEATAEEASKEGAEGEEYEGTEEEEEPEDADPRKWVPPGNARKFVWQFQMWHAKLLVKQD